MARQPQPAVLLAGFAPFAGEAVNPSWQAVREFDGRVLEGHRITAIELPCEFDAAPRALRRALRDTQPHVAIAVGLAGGRDRISLERVAINVIDARIPDNVGTQPVDAPVARSGPVAYFSTLPLKACLLALYDAKIPAQVSQTAGTYVCNQIFYALMHALRRRHDLRAGFVHVPWLPDQGKRHHEPAMPLRDMTHALEIIVATALTAQEDARVAAGAEM